MAPISIASTPEPIYDAAIIGAGPTGLACAIEIEKKGLKAVVIDKGCLVNALYNYPTNLTFFTTPELLEIGGLPMTSVREKPNRTEALKYYRRVAMHYGLDVRQYERVNDVRGTDGDFTVHTTLRTGEAHQHRAKKVIVSTGYYDIPVKLGAPGEDLDKVLHYYQDPHPYYDCDIAVVGGKNSAAIYALECHRAGARVTMIHRGETMHKNVKYWIRPDIDNRIKNNEIQAYFQSSVVEVRPTEIVIETPEGQKTLRNDFVLAMTGEEPRRLFVLQPCRREDSTGWYRDLQPGWKCHGPQAMVPITADRQARPQHLPCFHILRRCGFQSLQLWSPFLYT